MAAERSKSLGRAVSSGLLMFLWLLLASVPVSACAASPGSISARSVPELTEAESLTICTQNLWNYGSPESVHDLRRRNVSLSRVAADLARQEPALVARMSRCDVVAVQEIVGATQAEAGEALTLLAERLGAAEGHPYRALTADSRDVIRNGFLIRTDAPLRVIDFNGSHSSDRLPVRASFPRGHWDRGPAELVVEVRPAAARAGAADATLRQPLRVRVINAHLKSKIENERSSDPDDERWERLRVLQARALFELARMRLSRSPAEVVLVVGDINNTPGSAARAVLGGGLDPAALVTPRDCIGRQGELTCELPSQPSLLLDLAAQDPDLRGRGSYRFEGREELIDGIFATSAAAKLAAEPSAGDPRDYDVAIEGRFWQGSDHRLLRVTLHF